MSHLYILHLPTVCVYPSPVFGRPLYAFSSQVFPLAYAYDLWDSQNMASLTAENDSLTSATRFSVYYTPEAPDRLLPVYSPAKPHPP